MVTYDVNKSGVTVLVSVEQKMYDFIRVTVNSLYAALQDLIDDLPDITIDDEIYFTLPSGVSFKVAYKIEGTWTIPDFTLPERDLSASSWLLEIPGLKFLYTVTWPIFKWFDLIWPTIDDPILTNHNVLWKEGNNYVSSTNNGRYYSMSDGIVDGLCGAALILFCYGLTSFGAHKIQELMSQKALSTSSFKTTVTIKTVDAAIKALASDTEDVKETTGTIKSTTDSIKSTTDTIKSTTDDIKDTTDDISDVTTSTSEIVDDVKTSTTAIETLNQSTELGRNLASTASGLVTALANIDNALESLANLGIDTSSIVLAASALGSNLAIVMQNVESSPDVSDNVIAIKDMTSSIYKALRHKPYS